MTQANKLQEIQKGVPSNDSELIIKNSLFNSIVLAENHYNRNAYEAKSTQEKEAFESFCEHIKKASMASQALFAK